MFENIKKRDGRVVEFDSTKITSAIAKAGKATGEFGRTGCPKAHPTGPYSGTRNAHGAAS